MKKLSFSAVRIENCRKRLSAAVQAAHAFICMITTTTNHDWPQWTVMTKMTMQKMKRKDVSMLAVVFAICFLSSPGLSCLTIDISVCSFYPSSLLASVRILRPLLCHYGSLRPRSGPL